MNILIVEDDIVLADQIIDTFLDYSHINKIDHVSGYDEFLQYSWEVWLYDIVLVDIILSKNEKWNKNWFDILEYIRILNKDIPIIIISGISELHFLEKAFQKGANDYIMKPFRPKELKIRVFKWFQSYLLNLHYSHSEIIYYYDLSYHVWENRFYFLWELIPLTKTSKYILLLLIMRAEELVLSEDISQKIWCDRCKVTYYFQQRNLRTLIMRLKKTLSLYSGLDSRILTIRGEGYILKKTSINLI